MTLHYSLGDTSIGLFTLLFLFGFACIPLAYIVSIFHKKPFSGFTFLVIIYLLSGVFLMVPLGFCDHVINMRKRDFMSSSLLGIILIFSRFLPVFSMSFGIQKIYKIGPYQPTCEKINPYVLKDTCKGPISRDDPIWGCCQTLCSNTSECYGDANALHWGNDGLY